MKTVNKRFFCDIAFLAALLFKVFSQGLAYFPVLDDYIQYGGYPLYGDLSYVYLNIGTISTRPFAAILDPAVWGLFFSNMWVALLIISVMFFAGTKLIASVFERMDIHITPFLYAIVLLIPLGFEGTYWISASSRICVGLFFAGLASYMLTKLIEKNKIAYWLIYVPATVLSFGFYESVMVLSALLQLAVVLFLVKSNKKRLVYLITPAVFGASVIVYYKLAANIGAMGSRAGFSLDGIGNKIYGLFSQFFEILVKGGGLTTAKGAWHGLLITFSSFWGVLLLVAAIIISAVCAFWGAREDFSAKAKRCIPLGIGLVFLPLVPNLLSADVWLTYRSVVPVFFGLTLVSAPLFTKLLKNKSLRTAVIFFMVFLFSLGNINELDTYKKVSQKDNLLVSEIAQQLDNDVLSGNKETIVVIPEEIITPQVSYYKDHVKSVFDSDWALTGAVRAKTKNIKIKTVTPMNAGLFALADIDTSSVQIIYIGGNDGK